MRNMLKRTLGLVLALTLLAAMLVPTAFAAKSTPVTNPTKFKSETLTTYVGMKTTLALVDSKGAAVNASNYTWKSSKKSVVSVSKTGLITAKKKGSATITATNKSNKKDKCKIKVTVQKNIVDNLCKKPSPYVIPSPNFTMALKSVEIASPTKVVAKYYLIQNFPSSWTTVKLKYVEDSIFALKSSTSSPVVIAAGTVKNVKASAKGAKVKVVKVTYKGGLVKNTNICLKNQYGVSNKLKDAKLKYKYPKYR